MKRLITNERQRVSAWVAQRMDCDPWDAAALGLERDGELVAGVVLADYVENARGSLHCAGVGKYWLTRQFLHAVFDWCFVQLGLKVLVNQVSASNADSLRFTKHIGFTELARIPKAWDGESDLVLFELRPENCRWLGEHYAV